MLRRDLLKICIALLRFYWNGTKKMPNLVTYEQWFYEQDKQEAQRVPYIAPEYHQEMCKDFL